MKNVAIAVALLFSSPAVAQPPTPVPVQVGDPQIDAATLQPYKARWKETIVNVLHQTVERGTWDDELRHEQVGGREVLTRQVTITQPDGTNRERLRIVVDRRTFAPIRSEWSGNGLSYVYDFAGRELHGVRVNEPGGTAATIDVTLERSVFDYYGGMMELFLATLPRRAGAVFAFPAAVATTSAGANQSALHWPIVEVAGEESIRGSNGVTVKAWRMETNTPYGFYKVWVTDQPPYVVRTVLLLAPGGRITYELIH